MTRQEYFFSIWKNYIESKVDQYIDPKDSMNDGEGHKWYFPVGRSAIEVIIASSMASRLVGIHKILDIPCGHGRVTRHLRAAFPKAKLYASDLDRPGVEFCASRFRAIPFESSEDLTKVVFPERFDLIWVGSLFTHTSRLRSAEWLKHLTTFLTDQGIVVATFHGRYSNLKGVEFGYMDEQRWSAVKREYELSGYGYRDYQVHGHSYIEGSYGVSLTDVKTVIQDVQLIAGVRVFGYIERGWADHQDVLVIGRPGYNT